MAASMKYGRGRVCADLVICHRHRGALAWLKSGAEMTVVDVGEALVAHRIGLLIAPGVAVGVQDCAEGVVSARLDQT